MPKILDQFVRKALKMASFFATLFSVSAILASAPVGAQADHSLRCDGADTESCAFLLAATRAFTDMLTTADPEPLRRNLDRRALWVSSDGKVRSGAEFIEAVRRDRRRATARLDRAEVRFFDNTAVVSWQESWTDPDAAVKAGHLAGVDTWVKRGQRWRVVSTVETPPAL
ncbi:nuclear transport factor 2 family protein [Sphingomonas sp. TX0543]|uniref:nuclear transport factor 2 family protein n=1 Tax=unclassified Sphingomonas TaxID=196159 RepID=UPI0010F6F623|nr:nuclear transport factor 2 family protein [Sphingomonas sp. 3P27F8]